MPTLGAKIRFFRKRARMSQLELELAIEASAGMISRIEKDRVNPSRETLFKLSKAFGLNEYEKSYLYGAFARPVEAGYSSQVLEEIKTEMENSGMLGYIVDERSRVWYASEKFLRFMKLPREVMEENYGQTLHKYLFHPDLNVGRFLPKARRLEIYKNLLYRTRREMSFMVGDLWYEQVLKCIGMDDIAAQAWEEVMNEPLKYIHTIDNRLVLFKIGPIEISKHYAVEPVLDDERFRVLQWG